MCDGFGCLEFCGTAGQAQVVFGDSYFAFKAQLAAFVDFLSTGLAPFLFAETAELIALVVAGLRSREEGGREAALAEILAA